MLKCGNQIEKKNTRDGKNFLIIFLSSAKSIYIQPSSGQVFKMNWHNHAGEGEKQFSHKCFKIHLSIPQQLTYLQSGDQLQEEISYSFGRYRCPSGEESTPA